MMIYPAIHYTMGGIWVDYEAHDLCPVASSLSVKLTSPTTVLTASVLRL